MEKGFPAGPRAENVIPVWVLSFSYDALVYSILRYEGEPGKSAERKLALEFGTMAHRIAQQMNILYSDGSRAPFFYKTEEPIGGCFPSRYQKGEPVQIIGSIDGIRRLTLKPKERPSFCVALGQTELPEFVRVLEDRPEVYDIVYEIKSVKDRIPENYPRMVHKAQANLYMGLANIMHGAITYFKHVFIQSEALGVKAVTFGIDFDQTLFNQTIDRAGRLYDFLKRGIRPRCSCRNLKHEYEFDPGKFL